MRFRSSGLPRTHFPITDSTNTRALEAFRAGDAGHGQLFTADAQSAGRGRAGRAWESPPGQNLYLSLVLEPPGAPANWTTLPLVAGIACAETADALSPGEPGRFELKWPNDLLAGPAGARRKLAGILLEQTERGDGRRAVVLGIGFNLNFDPATLPPEVAGIATSLRALDGRGRDPEEALHELLLAFAGRYAQWCREGFRFAGPLREAWQSWMRAIGRPAHVENPPGPRGTVVGVDGHGRLLLRSAEGVLEAVIAGDVVYDS